MPIALNDEEFIIREQLWNLKISGIAGTFEKPNPNAFMLFPKKTQES